MLEVPVGHDGAHWTEGFDAVHDFGMIRPSAIKKEWRHHTFAMQVFTKRPGGLFRIYKQLSGGEQLLDRRLHITSLGGACKRSHIDRFKSCIADLAP